MPKIIWSFTVQNPVESTIDLPPTDDSEKKPKFGQLGFFNKSKAFSLPNIPESVTIFQVYLDNQKENNDPKQHDDFSPLKEMPADYGEEVKKIVDSKDYMVQLIATRYTYCSSMEENKKIYVTSLNRQMVPFLVSSSFSPDERQHKTRELDDSLMSLLFGLPLARPPPLWATVIAKGITENGNSSIRDNTKESIVLQIRRGFPSKRIENWTPFNAEILGEITLKLSDNDEKNNNVHNMLYQSCTQLMHAQRKVALLSSQIESLVSQFDEFMALKEVSEANILEKALIILNKKKEKMEQLRAGVDIPDDDDSALYDFYTNIGEFSKVGLRVDNTYKQKHEEFLPHEPVDMMSQIPSNNHVDNLSKYSKQNIHLSSISNTIQNDHAGHEDFKDKNSSFEAVSSRTSLVPELENLDKKIEVSNLLHSNQHFEEKFCVPTIKIEQTEPDDRHFTDVVDSLSNPNGESNSNFSKELSSVHLVSTKRSSMLEINTDIFPLETKVDLGNGISSSNHITEPCILESPSLENELVGKLQTGQSYESDDDLTGSEPELIES